MRKFPYLIFVFVTIVTLLATACAPAAKPVAATVEPMKQFKMAAIFPGVITDADYNTLAYVSLSAVKTNLGIQTAYTESVATADVESAMRKYVDEKFNVIWTHGGQFVTQTVNLARQFPDITFIAEGDAPVENAPANLWFITRNFHIGFYAVGVTAAMASKTGKIGYIGGQSLPFANAEVHAIQQALKEQNINVTFKTVWAGDFNDPKKARQVADEMISEGIDVIIGSLNLGMFGVFESVKASTKPILVTAKYTDKTAYAPKNYITSLIYDFSGPLTDILGKVEKGEKGGVYPLGFSTGVSLQALKNVDPAMQAKIDSMLQQIKDGKINVVNDVSPIQ